MVDTNKPSYVKSEPWFSSCLSRFGRFGLNIETTGLFGNTALTQREYVLQIQEVHHWYFTINKL